MLALLVYAVFGTSRHLSVGTTSALSIMVAGTLGTLALSNPDDYLAAAQLTAIIAGVIAVAAGLLKLGFVVNFISESVLIGFSTGAALYIASSQLSKLFGIEGVQGSFFERVWNVLTHLDDTNGWTLGLGVIMHCAAPDRGAALPKTSDVPGNRHPGDRHHVPHRSRRSGCRRRRRHSGRPAGPEYSDR